MDLNSVASARVDKWNIDRRQTTTLATGIAFTK